MLLLIKKGNGDSYLSCKFQLHNMQTFFKMATKTFPEWQPLPYTRNLTAYRTPTSRGIPKFSRQNDRKKMNSKLLIKCPGSVSFALLILCYRKKSKGGGNYPLR